MTHDRDLPPNAPETAREIVSGHSNALQKVLRQMSSVYNPENEIVPVRLGDGSKADVRGRWVQVDPEFPGAKTDPEVRGPNVLRAIDDILAHEMAHYIWSDLESKKKFAEAYPGWGTLPGHVANILEDAYVNARRCREWYGLRSKAAYTTWLIMQTDSWTPPVDKTYGTGGKRSYVDALHQVALAGYVKSDDQVPPDVREFVDEVRPLITRVRSQDDPVARFDLFHAVFQCLIRRIPNPDSVTSPDAFGGLVAAPSDSIVAGSDGGSGDESGGSSCPDKEPDGDDTPDTSEIEDIIEDTHEEAAEESGERTINATNDGSEVARLHDVLRDHDPKSLRVLED